MKKVAFLVNGAEGGAIAHRALAFMNGLPQDVAGAIAYRASRRVTAIGKFVQFLRRERADLTYVMDMGYSGVLAAATYKRLSATSVIIDTGDAIHELAKSMGRGTAGVALTGALEYFGLRAFDRVVVRGTRHAEVLAGKKIQATVIPDGVETDLFGPQDSTALRQRLGISEGMTIGLVGSSVWSASLGICYGWDLVEAVNELRGLPVRGVMIGDGSGIQHLRDRAESLGISDKMVFTGRVPYDQLPAYLSSLDICLSTQTNDLPGQVRTTGKLPLYLASGRYILASRVGEAELVLPEQMLVRYDGVVDRAYPRRLAERIRELLRHPDRLAEGQKGILIAREKFDYGVLFARVNHLVDQLLKAGNGSRRVNAV